MGIQKTKKTALKIFICILALAGFFATGSKAGAEETVIINNISSSAQTGNNQAGQINQGKSEIKIELNQSVNGVDLEPIIYHETSTSGKPLKAEVKSQFSNGSTSVQIYTQSLTDEKINNNAISSDTANKTFNSKNESSLSLMINILKNIVSNLISRLNELL